MALPTEKQDRKKRSHAVQDTKTLPLFEGDTECVELQG
jgi:hypothetical protein